MAGAMGVAARAAVVAVLVGAVLRAQELLTTPVTPKVVGIGAAVFVVAGIAVGHATHTLFVGVLLVVFAVLLVVPAWPARRRRRELIVRSLQATERGTGER